MVPWPLRLDARSCQLRQKRAKFAVVTATEYREDHCHRQGIGLAGAQRRRFMIRNLAWMNRPIGMLASRLAQSLCALLLALSLLNADAGAKDWA